MALKMKVTQSGTIYYIPLSQNSSVDYVDANTSDTQTLRGKIVMDTDGGNNSFYISRTGSTSKEYARHYVSDNRYVIDYNNDETASFISFNMENTDTESSDGSSANSGTIQFKQGTTGTSITINGSKVLTQADGGGGGGIDATTLEGVSASSFLRSDSNDTTIGDLTISKQSPRLTITNSSTTNANNAAINFQNIGSQNLQLFHEIQNSITLGSVNGQVLKIYTTNASALNAGLEVEGEIYSQGGKVWHSSNDGIGSGLNADLLGGVSYLNYLRSDADGTISNTLTVNAELDAKYIMVKGNSNTTVQRGLIDYNQTNSNTNIDGASIGEGTVYIGHSENGNISTTEYDNVVLYTGNINTNHIYSRNGLSFIKSSVTVAKLQYDESTESIDFMF